MVPCLSAVDDSFRCLEQEPTDFVEAIDDRAGERLPGGNAERASSFSHFRKRHATYFDHESARCAMNLDLGIARRTRRDPSFAFSLGEAFDGDVRTFPLWFPRHDPPSRAVGRQEQVLVG